MPVITLSRQYGAGGETIGRRVAAILAADFLDQELTEEVARRLHMPAEMVKRWDERGEGLILRLLGAMQASHPELAVGAPEEVLRGASDPDRIWKTVQEVIREAARSGNAVIVGRGGAFLLAGIPGAHHFRLVAPREERIRWLSAKLGWSPEETARRADAADKDRVAFLRRRFGVDPLDPAHFELVLNTARLGAEQCARLIVQVASGSRP